MKILVILAVLIAVAGIALGDVVFGVIGAAALANAGASLLADIYSVQPAQA